MMNRRNFIFSAGALGLSLTAPLKGIRAASNLLPTNVIDGESDKVLVIVQLIGGNDGLNSVVPMDQYGTLSQLRKSILPKESKLIKVTDDICFHQNMKGMQKMFQGGTLGVIQNVGYENNHQSHFTSTDVWTSGSPSLDLDQVGWLGRYFEGEFPGFPTGYPNPSNPHPPAISMSQEAHMTCQGSVLSFAQTVDAEPANFMPVGADDNASLEGDAYRWQMEYLRLVAEQTNEYGEAIEAAYQLGANDGGVKYPSGSKLSSQLKTVARLIDGGLQTKVYTVELGGFDTHANQGNREGIGEHAHLLKKLSTALEAFQKDIDKSGHADRVLGFTFSEFGRKIQANGSNGTDHGDAGPMFLFGNCITKSVVGENPQIDIDGGRHATVPVKIDFRDVYGSILIDWFKVSQSRVKNILYDDFTYLPLATGCRAETSLPLDLFDFTVRAVGKDAHLTWKTANEFNVAGFEVEVSTDGNRFSYMAYVRSTGNGRTTTNFYDSVDSSLYVGRTYYYRIKSVDVDGTSKYSPVRSVKIDGRDAANWSISDPYPNPASDLVTIDLYAPEERSVLYNLFDQAGRLILSDSTITRGGEENKLQIVVNRLPTGTYVFQLDTDGNGSLHKKIVVQH